MALLFSEYLILQLQATETRNGFLIPAFARFAILSRHLEAFIFFILGAIL